jgi:hypothetical protein
MSRGMGVRVGCGAVDLARVDEVRNSNTALMRERDELNRRFE